MKTKLSKLIIAAIITVIGVFLSPVISNPVAASDNACDTLQSGSTAWKLAGCDSTANQDKISSIVGNIISAVIGILGIVAVVFIVMGGIQYMTSAGDATKTKKAKDTILYACIGLAVAALAFTITQIAINTINGSRCPSGTTYDSTAKSCISTP